MYIYIFCYADYGRIKNYMYLTKLCSKVESDSRSSLYNLFAIFYTRYITCMSSSILFDNFTNLLINFPRWWHAIKRLKSKWELNNPYIYN